MPSSRRQKRINRVPVKAINGECSRALHLFKDVANRSFVVVKFSMIKALKTDEAGFHLSGDACQLGNGKGYLRSRECPLDSGHHVVYVSLPKNTTVSYKWMLMYTENRMVKEKECNRVVALADSDITIQDYFGVYTDLLTNIFHPDYHQKDQQLVPILFQTQHKVTDSSKQSVAVIGSNPELGRWRAINAVAMFETQPDLWATIIHLPKGYRIRYKFVVIEKSKYKRILYGEKQGHKVIVDDIKPDDDDEDTNELVEGATSSREPSQLTGIWSPATESAISIEQVEEQTMGSVASDLSLGTKASLQTKLSDITEDGLADDCADARMKQEISREQTLLLQELRKELGKDTSSDSLIPENCLAEVDLAQLEENLCPQGGKQKCTEWLAHQDAIDIRTDKLTPYPMDEGELQPLLDIDSEGAIKHKHREERDDFELLTNWADMSSVLDSLDNIAGEVTPNVQVTTDSSCTQGAVIETPMVDIPIEVSSQVSPTPGAADTSKTHKQTNNGLPENTMPLLAGKGSASDAKPNLVKAQANSAPLKVGLTTPSCIIQGNRTSSMSLKTSTVRLPSYNDQSGSNADTARKILKRLPWIQDLPRGLTCKVLNSLGILNSEKQKDIASQLTRIDVTDH